MQHLMDVEAIKQLKARYFRLLDTKAWPELADVFTEDVLLEVEREPGTVRTSREGRDAVIAMLGELLEGAVSTHHGHTPEIEVDGDRATGIWAMSDDVEFPNGVPGTTGGPPARIHGTG